MLAPSARKCSGMALLLRRLEASEENAEEKCLLRTKIAHDVGKFQSYGRLYIGRLLHEARLQPPGRLSDLRHIEPDSAPFGGLMRDNPGQRHFHRPIYVDARRPA